MLVIQSILRRGGCCQTIQRSVVLQTVPWKETESSNHKQRHYGSATTRIVKVSSKGWGKAAYLPREVHKNLQKIDSESEPWTVSDIPATDTKRYKNIPKNLISFPLQKDAGFVLENWKSVSMDVRKGERFPSVTRILQDTMPLNNLLMLLKWKRKMIQELGEEGFLKLNEETLQEGSALHRCIQMYFTGTPLNEIEVGEGNQGHWKSLSTVLPQITDVKATEKHIKHPVLQYGGYLDCLATYKGKLCVIDWKTSKTPKPTLARCFDSPLQTAAYTGAVNFEDSLGLEVENTLLVISYKSGQKAHVHFMPKDTSQFYWEKWLKRLYFYKEMRKRERAARDASDTDTY